MPDVTISYKGSQIASMDASGTKTLLTEGKYCEDDIVVQYSKYSPEVYAGEHHQPTPANYTVTVSLTNPVNPSWFLSCSIKDVITYDSADQWNGDNIGSISSASGSTNVESNSSSFGILVFLNGASISTWEAQIICTGGISLEENDGYGNMFFNVTGDGTITIDGVDYDD